MNVLRDTPTPRQLDISLAILRLALGAVFIAHGGQKLFVYGLDGVTAGFTQMGAPLPSLTAPLVAFTELLGGIALVIGLLTRVAAAGLAVTMLGAIFIAHLPNGFFAPNGIEFTLTLFAGALALVFTGAGHLSADHRFAHRRLAR